MLSDATRLGGAAAPPIDVAIALAVVSCVTVSIYVIDDEFVRSSEQSAFTSPAYSSWSLGVSRLDAAQHWTACSTVAA